MARDGLVTMLRRLLLFLLLTLGWAGAAAAEIEIHFHSKDMASTFPHAFVRLTGTDEGTGEAVDVNYGFTPVSLTPAILFGPVQGMMHRVSRQYLDRSDRHFSLKLTDAQYRAVLAVVERWRDAPQPNYRLNSRNCVHFVAEVAAALGLAAEPDRRLVKKPKSFLRQVTQNNLALIETWGRQAPPLAPPQPQPAAVVAPARH
ncbi:MAG TPA: hypothetical protein VFO51_09330 [Sphingomicrobium sp.]|nr:hypothetical protein [Sphingomicrobium sp.]